ncbi:MAG: BON domain-containing protein [Burkholderiales bacterium]
MLLSKKATGKKPGPAAALEGEQVAITSRSAAAPQTAPSEPKQDQHVAATPRTGAAPSSAALEAEINQALKDGKPGTVTARVENNLEVTLRGSVASAAEKHRAFLIARSFKEVERVKDQVFVVEE